MQTKHFPLWLQGLFASAAQTCTEDWRQFKKGPRIAQTLHPNFDPIQLKPKAGEIST